MRYTFLLTAAGLMCLNTVTIAKENENMVNRIKDTVFHEYDIRGLIGDEIVIEQTYELARAIAYYYKTLNPQVKTVAVGMDGRTHSPQIKEHLCQALMDSGMNVLFIGVGPSPMLYFSLYTLPVDAGLMITASHNPKEYNGIKVCLGTTALWGKQIKEIGQLYRENKYIDTDERGTYSEHFLHDEYVAWHVDKFSHLKNIDFPLVIDCANGAAGAVVPQLVTGLGWKKAQLLYADVDGDFPNHEADPIVEKNMQDVKRVLQTTDAVVGVGFDGDADRVGVMTKSGQLVAGDKLLAVFAHSMVKNNPGMSVVYNVISSAGLSEVLTSWGAKGYMVPVGRSNVEEKMRACKALLGGETSCHLFFMDRHFGYDDGIYGMLRLVEILVESHKTLEELLTVFPKKVTSPEFRIPCKEESKQAIVAGVQEWFSKQNYVDLITIDGVRADMGYGWGIMRKSNTQPVLSMRFESDSQQGLSKIKEDFVNALSPYYDAADLRTKLQM